MIYADDFMRAIAHELNGLATGLAALQNVLLLPSPAGVTTGNPAVEAMIALQDLDRLTQTAAALAVMLRHLANLNDARARMTRAAAGEVLRAGGLPSLADRMLAQLDGAANGMPSGTGAAAPAQPP